MNYNDPIFKVHCSKSPSDDHQVPTVPSKRKVRTDSFISSKQPRLEEVPDQDDVCLEAEDDEQDEEGGRFYGSGVSTTQQEILSYFDREDNPAEGEVIGREGFGERDIKKLAAGLEKAISINESRRAKFDDPKKYLLSKGRD